MKRKSSLAPFTIFLSILCWLSLATAAQPLTSRSATAASYLKRGNTWFAKGEWERAIAVIAGSNLRTRGPFSVCLPH
jgi:hypothetical protein